MAHLVSVNVGEPRDVEWFGRTVRTAIWKAPVDGPVPVRGENLAGDAQADLRVHGGPDKAVYAYAAEDLAWWAGQGEDVGPGTFGENLTTEGVEVSGAVLGEHWRVGTALFEVAQPREPCFKLGIRMGRASFKDDFAAAERPGAYLRIVEEGEVTAGDPVEVLDRPDHGLTVLGLLRASEAADPESLRRVLATGAAPAGWQAWAERRLSG